MKPLNFLIVHNFGVYTRIAGMVREDHSQKRYFSEHKGKAASAKITDKFILLSEKGIQSLADNYISNRQLIKQ